MGDVLLHGDVKVQVCSFREFFANAIYPMGIDAYQRPYVWDTEKVQELVDDLLIYSDLQTRVPYYMGNILLHQNDEKKKLFIIDGQQRLTTLCILYFVVHAQLIENGKMDLTYHSPLSIENIKKIQIFLNREVHSWKEKASEMFSRIHFTFITTSSEDLAFTFFDTQNYRGVKLNPTDLLKAYHLRAIGSAEHLQERCAARWEMIQTNQTLFHQKQDFTTELFQKVIWCARRWRGQREITIGNENELLTEFMKNTIKSEEADSIPLYPNSNLYAARLKVSDQPSYEIYLIKDETKRGTSAYLPFVLRQPIYEGLGFFLYAEKYAELLNLLYFKDDPSAGIQAVRSLYQEVWKPCSIYLRELFVLSTIMYFDKFAEEGLFEFSLWLDHMLGAIRLEKQYIFKEAPIKFLRESDNNLLDVISYAFRSNEVMDYVKGCSREITIFEKVNVPDGKGVQGVYTQNVLSYYNKTDFKSKYNWINQEFITRKLI